MTPVQIVVVGCVRFKRSSKFGACDLCTAAKAEADGRRGTVRPSTWRVTIANWPAGRVCSRHMREWEEMWKRGGMEEEIARAA